MARSGRSDRGKPGIVGRLLLAGLIVGLGWVVVSDVQELMLRKQLATSGERATGVVTARATR